MYSSKNNNDTHRYWILPVAKVAPAKARKLVKDGAKSIASRITKPKIRLSIIECKRKSQALEPIWWWIFLSFLLSLLLLGFFSRCLCVDLDHSFYLLLGVSIDSDETCHRFLSGALLLLTFWFFISSALKPFTNRRLKSFLVAFRYIHLFSSLLTVRVRVLCIAVGILFTDFYYHNLYVRHIRTNHSQSVKAFLCDIEFYSLLFVMLFLSIAFFLRLPFILVWRLASRKRLLFVGLCYLFFAGGLIIALTRCVVSTL